MIFHFNMFTISWYLSSYLTKCLYF